MNHFWIMHDAKCARRKREWFRITPSVLCSTGQVSMNLVDSDPTVWNENGSLPYLLQSVLLAGTKSARRAIHPNRPQYTADPCPCPCPCLCPCLRAVSQNPKPASLQPSTSVMTAKPNGLPANLPPFSVSSAHSWFPPKIHLPLNIAMVIVTQPQARCTAFCVQHPHQLHMSCHKRGLGQSLSVSQPCFVGMTKLGSEPRPSLATSGGTSSL